MSDGPIKISIDPNSINSIKSTIEHLDEMAKKLGWTDQQLKTTKKSLDGFVQSLSKAKVSSPFTKILKDTKEAEIAFKKIEESSVKLGNEISSLNSKDPGFLKKAQEAKSLLVIENKLNAEIEKQAGLVARLAIEQGKGTEGVAFLADEVAFQKTITHELEKQLGLREAKLRSDLKAGSYAAQIRAETAEFEKQDAIITRTAKLRSDLKAGSYAAQIRAETAEFEKQDAIIARTAKLRSDLKAGSYAAQIRAETAEFEKQDAIIARTAKLRSDLKAGSYAAQIRAETTEYKALSSAIGVLKSRLDSVKNVNLPDEEIARMKVAIRDLNRELRNTGKVNLSGLGSVSKDIRSLERAPKVLSAATTSTRQLQIAMAGMARSVGVATLSYSALLPLMAGMAVGGAIKKVYSLGSAFEYTATYIDALNNSIGSMDSGSIQEALLGMEGLRKGPQDLALGMKEFAKAGVSTADSLKQIAEMSKFATVAEMGLAEANKLVIGQSNAFGIKFTEAANMISAASLSSATSIEEMGTALSYTTELATVTGTKFEDVATAMAIMANAGIRGCYDRETDVLTKDGWKKWEDVTYDDEFATYNTDTGYMEFQAPERLIRYHHTGKMYKVCNKGVDLCVTPDHRMYVKRRGQKSYEILTASKIAGSSVRYLTGGMGWEGVSPSIITLPGFEQNRGSWTKSVEPTDIDSKLWATFLGWYIADGNCCYDGSGNYKVVITKTDKKPAMQKKMIKVFDQLPWTYNYCASTGQFTFTNQQFYYALAPLGKVYKKHIPEYAKGWGVDLLSVLFSSLMECDGCDGKYYTSSIALRDDMQELGLKLGYATLIRRSITKGEINTFTDGRKITAREDGWTVSFTNKRTEPWYDPNNYKGKHGERVVQDSAYEHYEGWVDYDDEVFCAEVPNGLLVVRRKGRAIISGNSKAGTALRTSILKMSTPTEGLKQKLDALGISWSAFSDNGQIKDLRTMFTELKRVTDGLPDSERVAVLKDLFGLRALKGGANILKSMGDEWDNLNSKVKQAGENGDFVEGVYNKLADTTQAKWEKLGVTIEKSLLQAFSSQDVKDGIDNLSDFVGSEAFKSSISSVISGLNEITAAFTGLLSLASTIPGNIVDQGLLAYMIFGKSAPGRLVSALAIFNKEFGKLQRNAWGEDTVTTNPLDLVGKYQELLVSLSATWEDLGNSADAGWKSLTGTEVNTLVIPQEVELQLALHATNSKPNQLESQVRKLASIESDSARLAIEEEWYKATEKIKLEMPELQVTELKKELDNALRSSPSTKVIWEPTQDQKAMRSMEISLMDTYTASLAKIDDKYKELIYTKKLYGQMSTKEWRELQTLNSYKEKEVLAITQSQTAAIKTKAAKDSYALKEEAIKNEGTLLKASQAAKLISEKNYISASLKLEEDSYTSKRKLLEDQLAIAKSKKPVGGISDAGLASEIKDIENSINSLDYEHEIKIKVDAIEAHARLQELSDKIRDIKEEAASTIRDLGREGMTPMDSRRDQLAEIEALKSKAAEYGDAAKSVDQSTAEGKEQVNKLLAEQIRLLDQAKSAAGGLGTSAIETDKALIVMAKNVQASAKSSMGASWSSGRGYQEASKFVKALTKDTDDLAEAKKRMIAAEKAVSVHNTSSKREAYKSAVDNYNLVKSLKEAGAATDKLSVARLKLSYAEKSLEFKSRDRSGEARDAQKLLVAEQELARLGDQMAKNTTTGTIDAYKKAYAEYEKLYNGSKAGITEAITAEEARKQKMEEVQSIADAIVKAQLQMAGESESALLKVNDVQGTLNEATSSYGERWDLITGKILASEGALNRVKAAQSGIDPGYRKSGDIYTNRSDEDMQGYVEKAKDATAAVAKLGDTEKRRADEQIKNSKLIVNAAGEWINVANQELPAVKLKTDIEIDSEATNNVLAQVDEALAKSGFGADDTKVKLKGMFEESKVAADDYYDQMVANGGIVTDFADTAVSQIDRVIVKQLELNAAAAKYSLPTSSGTSSYPARALGGPVTAGQPYIVGEVGQELFIPSTSGTIIPNNKLSSQSSSSSESSVSLSINLGGSQLPTIQGATKSSVDSFVSELKRKQRMAS
jgi:hypothetical protein